MRILDDRKSVLSAKFVRNGAEFAPRSVGDFALIMLGFKGLARVEIYVVYYHMIMDMFMVAMDGKHILILVIEKSLAKFLSDKQSPFGSYLSGGKALNYVLALASASSCADCLPDVSELF